MLRRMKKPVAFPVLALSLVSLAGCPEKKSEGDTPVTGKAAMSAPPPNSPVPGNAPAKPGGW
jgi:hypothetical protein